MDGWNTTFLLGSRPIFRGYFAVSFREGNFHLHQEIQVPTKMEVPKNLEKIQLFFKGGISLKTYIQLTSISYI